MAATGKKMTVLKKGKPSAAKKRAVASASKKKTGASASKKVSAKPLGKAKETPAKKKAAASASKKVSAKKPGKAKETPTAKKQSNKIPSARKSVAQKTAVKKTVAIKIKKGKKPEEKAVPVRDRLPELRKSLIRKKEGILKEVKEEISKYISGENKQLVDTANDDGDWAQVDISEDLSLQRLSAHRKLMHNIDEAILKIAEGTYGICEECGEEISEKRLLVLPTATLCIDCQEQKEQLEAFGGEE
jgi:DnaK suppressor protein